MKILSKYKDYYDYISHIYGEDPLLLLDRRKGYVHEIKEFVYDTYSNKETNYTQHTLYICGYIVDVYQIGKKLYSGDKLVQFHNEDIDDYWGSNKRSEESVMVKIDEDDTKHTKLYTEIRKDLNDYNLKEDCPIMYRVERWGKAEFNHFPRLDDFNIGSILPPDEIYRMLSEWYSRKRTEKENNTDNRTNNQKITGKGFDTKRSFRPNMK